MYFKKIIIINYRSCKDLVLDLDSDTPNTFIGKTDAGKTTILRAIGLLLDEKLSPVLLKEGQETCDVSTTEISIERYKEVFDKLSVPVFEEDIRGSIVIMGVFGKEKDDFSENFDQLSSDHIKWVIESDNSDELCLLRWFNDKIPLGQYFLLTQDNSSHTQLWDKNQDLLDGLIKELKITDNITNDNKTGRFKNVEKFRAIYKQIGTSNQWSQYNYFKKDKIFFPIYRYIDWKEITLKSVETLAQDTMSSIIEDYSSKLRGEAEKLSQEATEKVNEQIDNKIKDIITGLPWIKSIKAKVYFESSGVISEIAVEKGTSDGSVRLESQGDGVKKQIGFAFMRLAAFENLEKAKVNKKFLWAFDEPEVHLYPAEKREFYDIIRDLSKNSFQTIISTHSTVFVDKSKINTIKQAQLVNKYTTVSMCSSVSDVHTSLGIRNSDFLFYDILIGAEGDTEEILIPHFYNLYFEKDIKEDSVQIINLGGEGLWRENRKILEQVLKDFKNPDECLFLLLDKDTSAEGDNVFLVGKYDIEDSLEDKYWIELVKEKCGVSLDKAKLSEIRAQLTSSKKFHKSLSDHIVMATSNKVFLPSKKDCAIYMKSYIKEKDGIPSAIVDLFEKIKQGTE